MLTSIDNDQKTIASWFDNTYQQRGEWYLRPRVAYEVFFTLLETHSGQKILDVACGLGRIIETALLKEMKVSGIDISQVAINHCKNKYRQADLTLGNAEEMPYQDRSFDYITCLGSLERMLDRNRALQEMDRVLRPDGKLCLLVRNSHSWLWRYVQKPLGIVNTAGHQDAMNLGEWKALLIENGFEIIRVEKDQWPIMKWKRYFSLGLWQGYQKIHKGLLPLELAYEFIFICEKKKKS